VPDAVQLTALRGADGPALSALFERNAVPDVTRFFDPFSLDFATAHALVNHQGRDLYWGVWQSDALVGLAMVRGWDGGHENVAYGLLIDRESHGRGLGRLATRLMLADLFSRGVERVRARVHLDNEASLRMLRANGFQELSRDTGRVLLECRLSAFPL
jgi:RimJ/RimL family protein N-acetyltransferase